ncbi:hypothetical protein ACIOTI_36395 [Streptomyces sp. NPDC087843]|uniref:hypothetical protein n=1 Tax=Streptomyces sp. NPDC087843 TaxID=3365804 RepID=UPI0038152FAD
MTLSAVAQTLHRHGSSHQVLVRRAVKRHEVAGTGWAKETGPQVETLWRRSGLALLRRQGRVLEGAAHRPHLGQARTTRHPVAGTLSAPLSIAAPACFKEGERSRLIYRPKRHVDPNRGGRRSLTWTDYRDPLTAAHQDGEEGKGACEQQDGDRRPCADLGAPRSTGHHLRAHRGERQWPLHLVGLSILGGV